MGPSGPHDSPAYGARTSKWINTPPVWASSSRQLYTALVVQGRERLVSPEGAGAGVQHSQAGRLGEGFPAHTHSDGPQTVIPALYALTGVTTVREMWGKPVHHEWRDV
ncbi:hypothetical protein GCM10010307_26310 [Streptomyces vastus]|uniref:Uncharacterized protein n=1 Tax=Streptomyces vastus TaxID=285451 RepID=A0ABN3QRE5_9ACTN